MKKYIVLMGLLPCLLALAPTRANAQISIAEAIKTGVKKVIKAVDLKVQRLQNQTIALQNVQKTLEINMSRLSLAEIAAWVQKQKDLYQTYYDELWQVKSVIQYYHRVQEIAGMEAALSAQYDQAWHHLSNDPHFSAGERRYMGAVYAGILKDAARSARQLVSVVKAFTTEMSDAERMRRIDQVAGDVQKQYDNIRRFNTENALLSLVRSNSDREAAMIKRLYGL